MELKIEGILTVKDNHQHIAHPFTVPDGATHIDIDFRYSPKQSGQFGNLLTLSVFDPFRERGMGHRGEPVQHVTIGTGEATPGYYAGPIPAGSWTIVVNTNCINDGEPVHYSLEAAVRYEPQPAALARTKGYTNPRGTGWYRGDVHAHTRHSDGGWDVPDLLRFARERQLDFITLTDHNTTSGLAHMESLSSDTLLTMGGYELTTFYGHALALGLRQWIDWRVRPDERTMSDILREVEAAGGLFIIAHPSSAGDPVCTGCCWEYTDVMPGAASHIEVWNEHWTSSGNNETALQTWYDWLNEGYRLFATSGTDLHGPRDEDRAFAFNNVYAQGLSEAAIIDGIRRGHVYLSSGPTLAFTGHASTRQAMIGQTLIGETCELHARWSSCQRGDHVRLIVDGRVKDEIPVSSVYEKTWRVKVDSDTGQWSLIEVRDQDGSMRALTNPIFLQRPG